MPNMFDILGPITVGPSSSHTAGAVRLGRICRSIIGGDIDHARITFYGSFAETYRGHGTDKAVIGGLLGLNTNDETIRESLSIAGERGMKYELFTGENPRYHPNTMEIEATAGEKKLRLVGSSVGGGSIMVTKIDSFDLIARCNLDTLAIFHTDHPGVLAGLSYQLSAAGHNISNLRLTRAKREGDVVTVVETDAPVDQNTVEALRRVEHVSAIIQLPKI